MRALRELIVAGRATAPTLPPGLALSERRRGWVNLLVRLSEPLKSEANRSRHEHWAVTSKRVKAQRSRSGLAVLSVLRHLGAGPWQVTITRIGGKRLDPDNLAGSTKHVQDGVADALGVDDGDESRVRWAWEQDPGGHGDWVAIRIAWNTPAVGLDAGATCA